MQTSYPDWIYKGSDPVAQAADKLFKARGKPCRLAPLVLMTDPERLPDPVAAVQKLPRGSAVIYRHFGHSHANKMADTLRQETFKNGQQLLIGDDPKLATQIGADGVHFKRDSRLTAATLWRQLCPDWIISMAGIKHGKYSGDLTVLDAVLVSSVFESKSLSAGAPIGVEGFNAQVEALKGYKLGVFALGGINKSTAPKLTASGAAGLAGISFI